MAKSIPIVPSPLLFLPERTGSSLRHFVENLGAASRQSWPEHQTFPELAKVSLLAGHSPPLQRSSPQTAAEESNHSPFRILSNRVSASFFWKVFVSCWRWCDSSNHIFAFMGTLCMCGPCLGALRNDTKNGCKADYPPPSICIFWVFVKSYFSTIQIGHSS